MVAPSMASKTSRVDPASAVRAVFPPAPPVRVAGRELEAVRSRRPTPRVPSTGSENQIPMRVP